MSNNRKMTKDLSKMGFSKNNINRAFKIYKKNYGNIYNVSVLAEIILRLQSKANKKRHSVDHITANNKKHKNINMTAHDQLPFQIPSISYSQQSYQSYQSYNSCPIQSNHPLFPKHSYSMNHADQLSKQPQPPPPYIQPHSNANNAIIPSLIPNQLKPLKQHKNKNKNKNKTKKRHNNNNYNITPKISDDINFVKTPPLPESNSLYHNNSKINLINKYNFNSHGDEDVDDIDIEIMNDNILHKQCTKIRNKLQHRYSLQNIHTNNKKAVFKKRNSAINIAVNGGKLSALKEKKKNYDLLDNEQMIDKIIGAKQYKLWNFENERVDIYRYKCCNVKYQNFVPKLYNIVYPTILSSMTLPPSLCNINDTYKINVIFDTHILPNHCNKNKKHRVIKTDFIFDLNTKTQAVIDNILENIDIEWDEYNNLYKTCFMLKIEDREEYLKYIQNDKIIELNYVRECIRNESVNKIQFILVYSSELYNYSDYQYRCRLSSINKKRKSKIRHKFNNKLKYEKMGFNSILNTLHTLHKTGGNNIDHFDELTKAVNDEVEWLQNKIGGKSLDDIKNNDDDPDIEDTFTYNTELMDEKEEKEINYNLIEKEAILLSEFDHRIEIAICEILNIGICSRYNPKQHIFLLFRMELMFGTHIIMNNDIIIPKQFINENKISIPYPQCNFYSNKKELKYSMLPRECVFQITIYGLKTDKKRQQKNKIDKRMMKNEPKLIQINKESNNHHRLSTVQTITASNEYNDKESISKYLSDPIAFCRVPLINNKQCLNKGKKEIYLWPIPKKQAQFDPYSTNNFCITNAESLIKAAEKSKSKSKSVSIVIDFFFNQYTFDVVSPIVNPRRAKHLLAKIKPYNGKSNFNGKELLSEIIDFNGKKELNERDKMLISSNKSKLMINSSSISSLYTYLLSIHWTDSYERMECYDYLSVWNIDDINAEDFICLLANNNFIDNHIRLYAISQLNKLDDYTLHKYLFQLVEALKMELNHQSFLSRFLMYRALQNPYQIGHYLFWYLKSQLFVNPFYYERFALLLEEYLYYLPQHIKYNMFKQYNLMNSLKIIASKIRDKRHHIEIKEIKKLLTKQLIALNSQVFGYEENNNMAQNNNYIEFPLNPLIKLKRVKISKCCIPSNKRIILTFVTYSNKMVSVIFKYGDNLKYEILTTQLLSIMDMLWLKNNLDLKIKTYSAIQTGSKTGFIQIINNSKQIKNDAIGINSLFANNSQKNDYEIEKQRDFYARSCAGYCVGTWILGININKINCKNIHILNNGQLFYINFAHALFKTNNNNNKEATEPPFLFTNYMKFAIDQQSSLYQQFEIWMFNAYCVLRDRYKLFENLLLLSSHSHSYSHSQAQQINNVYKYAQYDLKFKLRFDLKNSRVKTRVHVQDTLNACLTYKDNNKIL